MEFDQDNAVFRQAFDLINSTDCHVFVSGKAGTGKTTFLKLLRANTYKRMLVAAPTGVAAINAEGVTIHSLFNLPRVPYVPENIDLFKSRTIDSITKDILKNLELLVIDEVSMVRCDVLDAIDQVLKKVRNNDAAPFGGLQILYIGDLYQLAPIASDDNIELLKKHYSGRFFVDAKVYQQAIPVVLELKKVYRQSEQEFVSLLNALRDNTCEPSHFELLNRHYQPVSNEQLSEKITLTTHNKKADLINESSLSSIQEPEKVLQAKIVGIYPPELYPTSKELKLKPGARVMLLTNDRSKVKKYYNGKMATVHKIEPGKLTIDFGNGDLFELEEEIWFNTRQRLELETQTVFDEQLGTFQQFPVKLAWAITIHKSQGLTFDDLVIDASETFAEGQVYVALSRLRSLDGLSLKAPLGPNLIKINKRVKSFMEKNAGHLLSETELKRFQLAFTEKTLMKLFDLSDLEESIGVARTHSRPITRSVYTSFLRLSVIFQKFTVELSVLFEDKESGRDSVFERVIIAADYLGGQLNAQINEITLFIKTYGEDINYKNQLPALRSVKKYGQTKLTGLSIAKVIAAAMRSGKDIGAAMTEFRKPISESAKNRSQGKLLDIIQEKKSPEKNSLELFRAGNTIIEIAKLTSLNRQAIEFHLASFLRTKEIDILDLMDNAQFSRIKSLVDQGNTSLSDIRKLLGGDVSFGQINAVITYLS